MTPATLESESVMVESLPAEPISLTRSWTDGVYCRASAVKPAQLSTDSVGIETHNQRD